MNSILMGRGHRKHKKHKHHEDNNEIMRHIHKKFKRHKEVAEMMGHDTTDPALLGGLLKNIISKVKASRQARIDTGNQKDFSLNTPFGTVNAGDSGFGYTANQSGATGTSQPSSGTIAGIDKKYLLIGGAVVAAGAILMMRK